MFSQEVYYNVIGVIC